MGVSHGGLLKLRGGCGLSFLVFEFPVDTQMSFVCVSMEIKKKTFKVFAAPRSPLSRASDRFKAGENSAAQSPTAAAFLRWVHNVLVAKRNDKGGLGKERRGQGKGFSCTKLNCALEQIIDGLLQAQQPIFRGISCKIWMRRRFEV